MSPTEELRHAARVLRERTALIDPGPWTVVPNAPEKFGQLELVQGAGWAVARARVGEASYIALMSPVVGRAVADWLEQTAEDEESGEVTGFDEALAVARACLGTDANEEMQR